MSEKIKVFIDGTTGTTGLRINERLCGRDDTLLFVLPEEKRRDPDARIKAILECDVAFLCLPDEVARETVLAADSMEADTIIIDTSTAHRISPGWAYGFPELGDVFVQKTKNSRRIAVPGCHASGFIALVYPLIEAGVLSKDALLSCFSLTGYSGGGKKMIAEYEEQNRDVSLSSPRIYALTQTHKHLPEMTSITGLENAPVFCPIVDDYYCGMAVTVPLFSANIHGYSIDDLRNIYREKYSPTSEGVVRYVCEDEISSGGFISANALAGRDLMLISVLGNSDRITLCAVYDNLGKGASGAAIQCLNIATGKKATKGLLL